MDCIVGLVDTLASRDKVCLFDSVGGQMSLIKKILGLLFRFFPCLIAAC